MGSWEHLKMNNSNSLCEPSI